MMNITFNKQLRTEIDNIAEVTKYLWDRGWAERNAGNISVNITEFYRSQTKNLSKFPKRYVKITDPELSGRYFFVTATGARLRELKRYPERVILIVYIAKDLSGYYILWGGEVNSQSTSEFNSHLKIHGFLLRNKFLQKAVIHTHPNHLIALTQIEAYCQEEVYNRVLWSMHPEVKVTLPEGIGFARYHSPGSDDLAEATIAALKTHRLIIWEKHGCVAIGKDVFEAFDLIDTANKAAEIFFICKSAGYEAQGLSAAQLKELVEQFGLNKK